MSAELARASMPEDEGERSAEIALDIVNMLWDKKKSEKIRDALVEIIKQLK